MEVGGLVHYMTVNTQYRHTEDEDVILVSLSVLLFVSVSISWGDAHLCSFCLMCSERQINSTGLY